MKSVILKHVFIRIKNICTENSLRPKLGNHGSTIGSHFISRHNADYNVSHVFHVISLAFKMWYKFTVSRMTDKIS